MMNNPANRERLPIPQAFEMFCREQGALSVPFSHDKVLFDITDERGNKETVILKWAALEQIDTRLPVAIKQLWQQYRQFPEAGVVVYQKLHDQILCWYQALTVDFKYIKNVERYFVKHIDSIETCPTNVCKASIIAYLHLTDDMKPREHYLKDTHREQCFPNQLQAHFLTVSWTDLERYWPKLRHKVKACEALGMEDYEIAKQVFYGQSPDVQGKLPKLPSDLVV